MKNEFSRLNRYELVSIISRLIDENEMLKEQLDRVQQEALQGCMVDRQLLERIGSALDRMHPPEVISHEVA